MLSGRRSRLYKVITLSLSKGESESLLRTPGRGGDYDADRRGTVVVAGVVDLGAVRDDRQGVDLGPQVHVVPRLRPSRRDGAASVGRHGHLHEEVAVRHDVPTVHSVFREGGEKVFPAAGRVLDAVEHAVAGRAAAEIGRASCRERVWQYV